MFVSWLMNFIASEEDVAQNWKIPNESRVDRLLREAFEQRRLGEVSAPLADQISAADR